MPDPTESIATSPWANQTDEDFGGPATTTGSNELQSSIDSLTAAVDRLNQTMGAKGRGGSGGNGKGTVTGNAGNPTFGFNSPADGGNSNTGFMNQFMGGFGGKNNGPTGKGGFFGAGAAPAAGFGAVVASAVSFGKGQMPGQVGMSSFVQSQALNMPFGSNGTSAGNAIRFSAYGARGQNLNAGALGTADASAGAAIIGSVSGTPLPQGSSFGRSVMGAANLYGYANPGQGYAASAQMAATQYNPQTSMAMMQAGMQPALTPGGGQQSSAAIMQGWSQRMFGKNAVNPTALAHAMRAGGVGDLNFQQVYGQQAPQFEAAYAATNRLMFGNGKNAPSMTAAAANTLMTQASRGSTAQMNKAQATLGRYGVNRSDQQQIQNLGATQTGRSSDVANSFNTGLAAATSSLTSFSNVLTTIVNLPGVNQLVGGSGGLGGTATTLANPGNILQGGGGFAAMAKGLGKKLIGSGAEAGELALAGDSGSLGMAEAIAAGATPVWVVGGKIGSGLGSSGLTGDAENASKVGMGGKVGKWALSLMGAETAADAAAIAVPFLAVAGATVAGVVGLIALDEATGGTKAQVARSWQVQKHGTSASSASHVNTSRENYYRYSQGGASDVSNMAGMSLGGRIPGYGGGDIQPALLEAGETVVDKNRSRQLAGVFKAAGVPGYAKGGVVTGTEVANYAKSLSMPGNKNLYTWGGGAMGAWDCSGFSANVYEKYGFFPGGQGQRHGTSESQYSDPLLKSAPDQPGALVFFDTHDGQTPPSHVGVSLGGGKYAGADGPQGAPNAINSSSGAMGFRIPKKGFSSSGGAVGAMVTGTGTKTSDKVATSGGGSAAGSSSGLSEADNVAGALGGSASGSTTTTATTTSATSPAAGGSPAGGSPATGSTSGSMSAAAISALWIKMGGAKNAAANMAKIAMAESTDLPSNVQKGQPPHLTGWGLYQITPTSGINQNGAFGNLLNASNNTRAAISLYNKEHYSPWTSDPVGAGLSGYASGTSGAAPGWALVGERGVEAVNMRGGEQVLNHAATMASGHGKGYAAGTGGNLTFGDIHIHQTGAITDPGATARSAQEIARQVQKQLSSANLVDQIASGVTHLCQVQHPSFHPQASWDLLLLLPLLRAWLRPGH
jgi:hypothetical protein